MLKLLKMLAAAGVLAVMTTGCAVNKASANVDPSARLDTVRTYHVRKFAPDERGIDRLIAENLRKRGYQVSEGAQPPGPVDAVVTYVDKWMWDITMYMLELTIQVRDPKTEFPLATGNSLHTSLTRKSPPEMVDEVLTNIMKEGKAR